MELFKMNATLAAGLWPSVRANWLYQLMLAIGGSVLLAISAKMQVPFWPVPMTMQPLAVLLIGVGFGPELGAATALLYLAEGASGLPVFAKGGGAAYLAGPTAGYLVSYPFAAAIAGWMTQAARGRSLPLALLGCALAMAVIYAFGFSWLSTFIGAQKAWFGGVQPFLIGDAVKVVIAALLAQTAWRQVIR
jgi:biotin transport system substrate-specific component